MWTASVVTESQKRKKDIEMKIAKKNFEIEVLQIELKYPENDSSKRKIWFTVE